MRHLLAGLIGTSLLGSIAAAQPAPCPCAPPPPPTAIEAALGARETVTVKTFIEIGQIGRPGAPAVDVTAVTVQFPQERGRVVKGVRVHVAGRGEPPPPPAEAFVDFEECSPLVAALAAVLDQADAWKLKALDQTEVSYTTRGGLVVGFVQGTAPQRGFVGAGDATKSSITLPFDSVRQLRDFIAGAAAKLGEP
ncbi:MAG: hypothetical protein ACHQQS_07770 [Thermoanaerobaculales bacterium]